MVTEAELREKIEKKREMRVREEKWARVSIIRVTNDVLVSNFKPLPLPTKIPSVI